MKLALKLVIVPTPFSSQFGAVTATMAKSGVGKMLLTIKLATGESQTPFEAKTL